MSSVSISPKIKGMTGSLITWSGGMIIGFSVGLLVFIRGIVSEAFPDWGLTVEAQGFANLQLFLAVLVFVGLALTVVGFYLVNNSYKTSATQPVVSVGKFCRYCGSENKSDAVFCQKCGKPLN